jgi:hypothetical protein
MWKVKSGPAFGVGGAVSAGCERNGEGLGAPERPAAEGGPYKRDSREGD